jgi:rhodanese-related sulfurtransferase
MTSTISMTTPQALDALIKNTQTVELIDVRTPAEYRDCHIASAQNIPLDSLDPKSVMKSRKLPLKAPLYIICQAGNRSLKACEQFHALGFTQIVNIEGGTRAWQKMGLPVIHGQTSISIERQVRIAAGSLVLVGALLSVLMHPAFIALSAFVGAGLIFSGITNSCAMAMILTKMPWNRN